MSKEKLKKLINNEKTDTVEQSLLRKHIKDWYKGNTEHDFDEYDQHIINIVFQYVQHIQKEQKQCTKCKRYLPFKSFYKDKKMVNGLRSACKVCSYLEYKNSLLKK